METRFSHLNAEEKKEVSSLLIALDSRALSDNGLASLGELIGRADSCDPLSPDAMMSLWSARMLIFIKEYGSKPAN